ncbi:caspase family protein [Lichenibacterium dinghuense]|uniref:caspase family protein n=1 Tax=Lichenibacterium dinghuense TaxID=2895977 RepID=UPI0021038A05|nr:caspase family protein [Lichenibacterium sp. 6Y81]
MFKGRIRPIAVASALLAASSPHAAAAPPRVALVLSESNYPDADRPLKTPVSDGKAVAEALARRGFEVQTAVDAGGPAMADAVRHFLDAIRPGAVAAVYFSGVGIQVAGKNYLVPTDARIWSDADVLRAGTSVDALVRSMADRGARAEVLILDASRRNPFERRFRSVSAGLAALRASPGALTLASAAPGALVGESGDEAVFAAEFAKAIETPGIDAEQAFLLCRDQVAARTQSQQNPSVVSGLDVPFSFDPEQAAKPLPPPAVKAGVPPPPPEPAPPPPVKVAALPPPAASTPASDPPPAASAPPAKADVPPAPAPAAADAPKPAAEPAVHGSPPPPPAPPTDASPAKASVPPPPASTATAGPAPAAADGSVAAPAPPVKVASLPPNGGAPPSAVDAPAETPMSSLERARQAELDRRIGRNPRDQDALFERGRLLAQHGSYTLALLDFDRAISLAPDDADAFNDRCWTRSMVGQLQTAMDDCDRALKLRPNFADAHDSRGLVQMKRGSVEAALVDYDAAVRLDPKQSSALYGRGIAKLRLGRREAAEKDISDALALDPGVEAEYARYGLK